MYRASSSINVGSSALKKVCVGSDVVWEKGVFSRKTLSSVSLSTPSRGLFVSPAGNMFATDWSGKYIRILDASGTQIRTFTPLSGKIPYGITGDATYLYICYWDSPNIYKYQYSGTAAPTLKATWAMSHQNNCGMDVYNGYLYVASMYDKKVMKIDVSSGTATDLITGSYDINDLCVDTANNRIVTVQRGGAGGGTKGRVIIYNMSGTSVKNVELSGTYTSSNNSPQGVVVDSKGYIYLGGAYNASGSYTQGLMILNSSCTVVYDISNSVCPTFCYLFGYDKTRQRIVWVGSQDGKLYYIDMC